MTNKRLTIMTYAALFLCAVLLAVGFTSHALAQASAFAESPCDPWYYDSLKSRAWMEAQREVTQNQNLISKPDSVLEYTCFDQFASVMAANAHKMFSENRRWGKIEDVNLGDMATTLQNTVGTPLQAYVSSNFDGPFMDGRVNADNNIAEIKAVDGNNFKTYNCNKMNEVWNLAKCTDFAEKGGDGFFTLEDYATGPDKRSHQGQSCAPDVRWGIHYNIAAGATWPADDAKSYSDLLGKPDEKGKVSCGDSMRIPTGIMNLGKPEFVCLTPGCISRDGGACQ